MNSINSYNNGQINLGVEADTTGKYQTYDLRIYELTVTYTYHTSELLQAEYDFNFKNSNGDASNDYTDLQDLEVTLDASSDQNVYIDLFNFVTNKYDWIEDLYSSNTLNVGSSYFSSSDMVKLQIYSSITDVSNLNGLSSFSLNYVGFKFCEDDPPALTVNPLGQYYNTPPTISGTVSDGNGISCVNFSSSDGLSVILKPTSSSQSFDYSLDSSNPTYSSWFNSASQGSHQITIITYDNCLNPTNETVDFTIDTKTPSFTIISMNGNTNITAPCYANSTTPTIQFKINDANPDPSKTYVYFEINNEKYVFSPSYDSSTGIYTLDASSSEISSSGINFGSFWSGTSPLPAVGEVTFYFEATDLAGNINNTFTSSIERITTPLKLSFFNIPSNGNYGDVTAPEIEVEIDNFADNSFANTSSVILNMGGANFTMSEKNLVNYLYFIDGSNSTFASIWNNLSGSVTLTVYASDLAGEQTIIQTSIYIDRSHPDIEIISPSNGTYYNGCPQIDIITTDHEGILSISYTFSNNPLTTGDYTNLATYYNGTNTATINSQLWGNLSQGNHTLTFKVYDINSNVNYSSVTIFKDTQPPVFTNLMTYINSPFYDFNISKLSLNASSVQIFYSNMTLIQNATLLKSSGSMYEFSGVLNKQLKDGNYTFYVRYHDLFTNPSTYTNNFSLIIDSVDPVVNIWNFGNDTAFHNAPSLNFKVKDANPKAVNCTFLNQSELFDITKNQTVVFSLDKRIWNSLPDGNYSISIDVSDMVDHVSYYTILVIKDTTPPDYSIEEKNGTIYYESSPILSIVSNETQINYFITSNFIDNYSLTLENNSEYLIPADLWASLPYSNLTFYIIGVDEAGNTNISSITLQKWDSIAPSMVITAPLSCGSIAPLITIDITDDNLKSVYYVIDGNAYDIDLSSVNISKTTTINFYINQDAWNAANTQVFNITIFSVDKFGNSSNKTISILRTDYVSPWAAHTHKQRGNSLSLLDFFNASWQVILMWGIVFIASFSITRKVLKKSIIPNQLKDRVKEAIKL